MKYLKIVLSALLIGVVPVLAVAGLVHAQTFTPTVDKNKTIDSSLYSAGQNVDIAGTINGDVYCAGQNVTVDADVHGDVLCTGQNVTINGTVDGNVRVAGQTVHIGANVIHSLSVIGQTVTLEPKANVGQDITVAASSATLKGAIGRDVIATGSELTLNSTVARNVKFSGDTVRLQSGTVVAGYLDYTSKRNAVIADSASVKGAVHHTKPTAEQRGIWRGFGLLFFMLALVAIVVLTLAAVLLAPQALHKTTETARRSLAPSLLTGLLAGLAVPVLLIGMALTLVGIPLAMLLFVLWIGVCLLSVPVAAYFTGRLVRKKSKKPVHIALWGAVVLGVLYFVPIVNIFVLLASSWIGTGAILLTIKHHWPKPTYEL
ncbi:MAG TPA: polymer-forming cytoskeletal protein [Nevskiaceae bacterium]|nr:polymer-forming cytoskeletal protein [Nevskiaceae bacterium]